VKALADWYPGDGVVFAGLEVLGLIAALVALAWAAERLRARRQPALRAGLWLAALAGVLLTPAVALLGRQLPWRVAVLPPDGAALARPGEHLPQAPPTPAALADGPSGAVVGERSGPPAPPGSGETVPPGSELGLVLPRLETQTSDPVAPPPPASGHIPGAAEEPPASPNALRALATLALLVWGLGSTYLGARLFHGSWRVRGLLRRLRPLDGPRWEAELTAVARALAVARLPEICLSPGVRSPLVAGLFTPRVVLPEALLERGEPDQLRAVLVHECAHVVRHDPWVHLLQRLAAVLFWVHPLVHLLNQRLDRAREEVCDNHVLACVEAPAYAQTLLTVAQICYPVPRLEGYLTMMPRHYTLTRRVADLLDERRDTATRLPAVRRIAVLTALVVTLGALSSVRLQGDVKAQAGKGKVAPPPQPAPTGPARPAAADRPPEPLTTLRGAVITAEGTPAAGAVVWAAKFSFVPPERRETTADAKGRYALPLEPGEWWVWARRGTQGGEGQARSETIRILAGQVPGPRPIRLEERGTFRGRLLEAETGKPISGGKLFLDAGLVLTTGADGRFEVGGLSREAHEAFVVAPGRMRMRLLFDNTARAETELEAPVPRAGKIVGRVTDPDGRPIPGARVGREGSGKIFSLIGLWVACDARGRFEYDDAVPPSQPTRLSAAAPGYAGEWRDGLVVPDDGRPLELHFRLRPVPGARKPPAQPKPRPPGDDGLRTVSGVVRGPDQEPVAGVLVSWGYQPDANATQTRTDTKGRFRISVPDKAVVLAVLPHQFSPQFPAVAAGANQTVEVQLRAGRTARGRVLDETGKPVKDVQVIAVVPSPDPRAGGYRLSEAAVRTDAAGKFELQGLPDGPVRFDFFKPGMSDVRGRELTLDGENNTVTVKVSYGGAIYGRVVDRHGKPIRSFRVLVNAPRDRRPGDQSGVFAGYIGIGVRFTSADGSFVLTDVGAGGVFRVTALAEGYGEATVDRVTAVPLNHLAATKPVVLRAGPPVSLRVRTLTADGRPVTGALVTLVNGKPALDQSFWWGFDDANWEDMVRGRTTAEGWADFPALGFSGATVLVQAPGYARQRVGWRDGRKEVTVKMPPEAVLTGEIRDGVGRPVATSYVNLMSGGDQITARVGQDDKGRFRVAGLPERAWTITIRGDPGGSTLHQEKVELKAGETKELKIETKVE
jgi:beta-lactamase regulating signal transducer with metallopeptidase domain/protocatechuate 3,4-dioxygenase beta subunit